MTVRLDPITLSNSKQQESGLRDQQHLGPSAQHTINTPYFSSMRQPRQGPKSPKPRLNQRIPDEHSALVPPLPIPNRAVKRRRADDSMDYPCESRSSSGPKTKKPRPSGRGFLHLEALPTKTCYRLGFFFLKCDENPAHGTHPVKHLQSIAYEITELPSSPSGAKRG